jgi:hypothetical protein
MKLLDPDSGLMECRVCGFRHHANLTEKGKYRRGSWQCPNGCKPDSVEKKVNKPGKEA